MGFIENVGAYLLSLFTPFWHLIVNHPVAFAVIMIVTITLATVCAILDESGRARLDQAMWKSEQEDDE